MVVSMTTDVKVKVMLAYEIQFGHILKNGWITSYYNINTQTLVNQNYQFNINVYEAILLHFCEETLY